MSLHRVNIGGSFGFVLYESLYLFPVLMSQPFIKDTARRLNIYLPPFVLSGYFSFIDYTITHLLCNVNSFFKKYYTLFVRFFCAVYTLTINYKCCIIK